MPGILIVDDHPAIRTSVRMLLDAHSLQVCGEAADGKVAIEKVWELRPDIVLLDISMPIIGGFEVAQEIRRTLPWTRIVFLSLHDSRSHMEKGKLLSQGFVQKSSAATELIPLLKKLLEAERSLSYPWQRLVVDAFASAPKSLPQSISVAERTIASRFRQEIDSDERIALKDALNALQKLIVETTPSEVAENAKGVA